jgi:hypothetical protein
MYSIIENALENRALRWYGHIDQMKEGRVSKNILLYHHKKVNDTYTCR